MGQHSADSFKKEFIDGCRWAFDLYPGFFGKTPEEYAEIIPVAYNDIFDEHRERMANRATPITERLQAIPGMSGNSLTEAVSALTEIESEVNDDEFFKTHWLDVLFYRFTTLGEVARIRLGEKISHEVGVVNGGGKRVHVLGHSLGTTVVHDCLAKLYDDDYVLGNSDNLSDVMHKLGSVHMVANTSRVLQSFVNVNESLVKPGPGGCTFYYREYRHTLDPITWPKSFNPTDNGRWISNDSWYFKRYELVRPSSITNEHGNTHNIQHYLANPLVHQQIFKKIFDIELTDDQKKEGHDKYVGLTLGDVADDLHDALEDLKEINIENITGLIESAKALKDFVEKLGGEYNV
tara:strand:+ start:2183 stop:3229 length:1047 start_codon:yes stop_codon:yes gene_type:complete